MPRRFKCRGAYAFEMVGYECNQSVFLFYRGIDLVGSMLNDLVLVHINSNGHDERKQIQPVSPVSAFVCDIPPHRVHLCAFSILAIRDFPFVAAGVFY